jgi:hypothetical protein
MGGTQAPPEAENDHGRIAAWLGVFAGTLGVIAAVITLIAASSGNGNDDASPGSTATTSVATTTPSTTTTTNATTTSSSMTSPPAVSPGIFHETVGRKPIRVLEGYGVDLDSQEPNWGVTASSSRDFYVTSGASSIGGSSSDRDVQFAIVKAPPTFEQCQAQTALQTVVEVAQTIAGQHLCVLSSQGRWAYVHIARIDQDTNEMAFDIRVWTLSTDP